MTEEIDYQDYQKALQFDQRVSRMGPLHTLVEQIVSDLGPQESHRVLDLGTGTGRLGMALQPLLPLGAVIGLDSGKGMLKVAREKILNQQIENFLLVRGRAEWLPFRQRTFDSACLMLSFHHFSEPARALRELHGVLKSGGYVVSLDPVLHEPENAIDQRLNESIEEAFQEAHGPHFRFFTANQLRNLYRDAGFTIVAVQPHEFVFESQRMDNLPMGPHWLQARENLWFRREKDLLSAFQKKYFKFETTAQGLLVTGKMNWMIFKVQKGPDGRS